MVGAEPTPGKEEDCKECAETRATENAPETSDEELSEALRLCAAEAGVDAMLRA